MLYKLLDFLHTPQSSSEFIAETKPATKAYIDIAEEERRASITTFDFFPSSYRAGNWDNESRLKSSAELKYAAVLRESYPANSLRDANCERGLLPIRLSYVESLVMALWSRLYLHVLICSTLAIMPLLVLAEGKKLSLPRFASIKSNEVNARVGPSIKSSIEWVFIKKGEPVEIIEEYEQWRQIQDIKGEGGWVHSSVLSGKRSVIIISPNPVKLTKAPNDIHKVRAIVHNKVRCLLNKCQNDYCQISCQKKKGWLPKGDLWGVYKNE